MKKNYIRPESRLFAINLAENIAESNPDEETIEGGVKTKVVNGIRLYSGVDGAVVTGSGSLSEAFMYRWMHGMTAIEDNCMK